jgi:hypothetical protein
LAGFACLVALNGLSDERPGDFRISASSLEETMNKLIAILGAVLAIPAAHATVLFTDSTESAGDVLQFGANQIAVSSSLDDGFAFSLAAGSEYEDIGFDAPLSLPGGPGGTTTAEIFSESGGLPSALLGSVTVTPPSGSGEPTTITSGSFSPSLTLTGGTTYFLVLKTTAEQVTWWGTSPSTNGNFFFGQQLTNGISWNKITDTLGAFDITGNTVTAAPEPGTIALLLGGIGAMILFRKRRFANR